MNNKPIPEEKSKPDWLAGLLSAILPGLGQAWKHNFRRGGGVFALVASSVACVVWYEKPGWYVIPIILWAWNIWDAASTPRGAPFGVAFLFWLVMAYGIGWQVTEIHPMALIDNPERASSILRPMLRPDFLARRENVYAYWVEVQVPCSAEPPRAQHTMEDVTVAVSPDCASVNETMIVTGRGLRADYPTEVTWSTPIGDIQLLGGTHNQMLVVQTDSQGSLSTLITIPVQALAAMPDPTLPLIHRVYLTQRETLEGYVVSENGHYILQGIYETLALALLATTLGAILALPFSFLAARNLMGGHPVTAAIYVATRSFLNFFRSIESLILAIIFVIIVGLGPFPGMLALTLHTIAALGKLYSEVIEGIDPGPIEAVRATGANWAQVVRYAVVPQIIPPFTALTIYRWDINVRSSTIIGFVGGGGIGFFLYQWILIGDYRAVSSSFIAIAVVVIILDFFSARLRERLI